MRSPSWLGRANSWWLRRLRKMRRTASVRGARRRLSPRQCLNLSSSISARPAAQVSAVATDLVEPVVVATPTRCSAALVCAFTALCAAARDYNSKHHVPLLLQRGAVPRVGAGLSGVRDHERAEGDEPRHVGAGLQ